MRRPRKDDLGGAGGDEVAGVALIALPHDQLAGRREPGPEQLLHPLELLVVEIGEQIEAPDQLARIEAEVKTRPRLSRLRILDAALEIFVDLGRDQAFLEQRVIASHLAAQRRLTQEPGFESRRVLRILTAQRVERGRRPLEASLEDGVDEFDDPLAEDRTRSHGMRGHELLDQ